MHALQDRIWAVAWSTIVSFLIVGLAGGIWGTLYVSNLRISPVIPWSVPVMALLLWLLWQYLSGRWWPRSTSQTRRRYLRANSVSLQVFSWATLAGALGIVALAGYWIMAFNLVKMSGNALPDISSYPWLTLVLIGFMGSLVSPLSEEATFRGYAQVRLERVFPGSAAIMISSVLFALAHFTQGLFLPKLVVYYLAGVMFGVMAYLTDSILPGIATHIMADLTFFFLVWPYDTQRRLVWETGADRWFWIHIVQAIIFTVLTILAFKRLAMITAYRGRMRTSEN